MSKETESVFEKISREYYELTASEKKTADFVMNNQYDTQYMSIAELAEASDVAEATVSRFCRRLGYKGYNAFKLAVANSAAVIRHDAGALYGQVEATDSFEDMCSKLYSADTAAMGQTKELLSAETVKTAVDILEAADKVICMGQGGSMILAEDAAHVFSTMGNKFFPVSDAHLQVISAATMTEKDVILFFSYSGATRDMMDTLSIAKEQGAKIILITRFPKSPGAVFADVVLQCGSSESPLQMGSVAAKIAQLFLVDIIFSEMCRRDMDKCFENRERIAAALSEKHL